MAPPAYVAPGTSFRRLCQEWRPNGTYAFLLSEVMASLDRLALRKEWQQPPERGSAVIKTWHNRHPRTRAQWLNEQAKNSVLIEVPADAMRTWLDVAEDLIERRSFVTMNCPRCQRNYVPSYLTMQRYRREVPNFITEGRTWSCPGGHQLLDIQEWSLHYTERSQSFHRREE